MSNKPTRATKRDNHKPKTNGDVGYKQPPEHSQWKKGDPSPNRLGRGAKRQPKPDEMADAVSRMQVPTGDGDGKVTAFEAIWSTAFNEALRGNYKARSQILKQREAFEAVRPPPPAPEWRVRRITEYHDGVPVKVIETPFNGREGDPIPPPRKKRKLRRRKSETFLEIFDRIASTPVKVGSGGRKRRVTAEEAIWLSIFADASRGDDKALRLVTRYAKHARNLNATSEDDKTVVLTLNIGNARVVSSGPKISFRTEYFE